MTTQALLVLAGAGVVLALISVLIDRLNFPQPRFRARKVVFQRRGPHRDRTGAHIIEDDRPSDPSTGPGPGSGRRSGSGSGPGSGD